MSNFKYSIKQYSEDMTSNRGSGTISTTPVTWENSAITINESIPVLGSYTGVTIGSINTISIDPSFSINFSLSGGAFSGNNGYNGALCFAWSYDYFNSTPAEGVSSLLQTNYLPEKRSETHKLNGGGFGPKLWDKECNCGFALTLYPASDGSDENTFNVSHYKICVRKDFEINEEQSEPHIILTAREPIIYEDDLPRKFNLSKPTTLSLSMDEHGYLCFYLNGVNITSFYINPDCSLYHRKNYYFHMCEIAGQDSICSYTVNSINNIPALFVNQKVGNYVEKLNSLLSTDDLSIRDRSSVQSIFTLYESLTDSEKILVADKNGSRMNLLSWYNNTIEN